MKNTIKIQICVLLLLGVLTLYSMPHNMRNLSTTDGLNDLLINVIHRDTCGMVWLGTGSTIESFDGVRVHTYPIPGNAGTHQRVTAIVGRHAGELYVSNGDGIFRLKEETLQPIFRKKIALGVQDPVLATEGTLYASTSRGLYVVVEDGQSTHYLMQQLDLAAANQLRAICLDELGTLWMTSKAGLHSLSRERQISHYLHNELPAGGFTTIAVRNGTVYLGTFHNGIYTYDILSGKFRPYFASIVPITALQVVGQDSLFIGTDGGGVYLLNTRTMHVDRHLTQQAPHDALTLQ